MKKFTLIFAAVLISALLSGTSYSQSGFKPLIEFGTGTWCQWCPCGDDIIHGILQNYPNTLVLAYHGPANTSSDPFSFFNGNAIMSQLGVPYWPAGDISRRTGMIDRSGWNNPVVIQTNQVVPSVSIATTKSYNSSTRQLDVTANVTALRNIDTSCKVNFVLTEDFIVYPQTGNGSCPGSSNYVHEWVVRNMVNGSLGEVLNSGSWTQGNTITRSWTTTLPSNWVDNNMKVNVFVYAAIGNLSTQSWVQQTKKEAMLTGIENQNQVPVEYSLSQNYPNPFNPVTNIKFSILKDGFVSFKVYDAVGNQVALFVDGFMKAGTYNAEFEGSEFATGVYFYRLIAGDFTQTKKMILSK